MDMTHTKSIRFDWSNLSELPWNGIETSYAIKVFKSDNTFIQIKAQSSEDGYIYANNKEAIILTPQNSTYVTFTTKRANASGVKVEIDAPYPMINAKDKVDLANTVHIITEEDAIRTQFYISYSNNKFAVVGDVVKSLFIHVKKDDVVEFTEKRSTLVMRAIFRPYGGEAVMVGNTVSTKFVYTVPSDGVMNIFYLANEIGDAVCNPKNQIKIDVKNIVGLDNGTQFNGLDGVAFGTSLTYNASVTHGYLTRLSLLSGITFDNQGVGSSTILGDGGSLDMLAKIKAYSSYSGKRVCILEGFVNDWYQEKTLGSCYDSAETTVCGCVRSALNYMLTQNPNMTVFLILDHYGRQFNTLDCSSTAVKGGKTQYEYYEEIAKVAESLGIPVIKEYALSGISELMPQYLADNIHLNALGATQSANVIWNKMMQTPLNAG